MPKPNGAETLKAAQDGIDELLAIAEKEDRGLSEDEIAVLKCHEDLADEAKRQIEALQAAKVARARHQERQTFLSSPLGRITQPNGLALATEPQDGPKVPAFISNPRHYGGRLSSFVGDDAQEQAYYASRFYLATLWGNKAASKWCELHGMPVEWQADSADSLAMQEGQDSKGGYVVPDFISNNIVRLRETYGVMRQQADIVPMPTETYSFPRETSDVTAYFGAELAAMTASDLTLDRISLTARKLYAFTDISNEITEDSAVSIADRITNSIAYAFAKKEDDCGFLGTGANATYGGINGLITALAAGSTYTSVVAHTAFSTLTLADFEGMIGALPSWAMKAGAKWYISQAGWAASMMRLADAAGGNTAANVAGGPSWASFLGFPVIVVPNMNATLTAQASTTGLAYFGNMPQAVKFGDRRGLKISSSSDYKFNQDVICIKGTSRFDIVVSEPGTSSVAGSMLILKTGAAS